jgi:hypothetical protein
MTNFIVALTDNHAALKNHYSGKGFLPQPSIADLASSAMLMISFCLETALFCNLGVNLHL